MTTKIQLDTFLENDHSANELPVKRSAGATPEADLRNPWYAGEESCKLLPMKLWEVVFLCLYCGGGRFSMTITHFALNLTVHPLAPGRAPFRHGTSLYSVPSTATIIASDICGQVVAFKINSS